MIRRQAQSHLEALEWVGNFVKFALEPAAPAQLRSASVTATFAEEPSARADVVVVRPRTTRTKGEWLS